VSLPGDPDCPTGGEHQEPGVEGEALRQRLISRTGAGGRLVEPRGEKEEGALARIFHESLAATTDLAVLPGVLGCWPLRRTVQVRLGTNPLRWPGGTPIFAASRHQFMKHPGYPPQGIVA
jgi:hypothetical protein